RRPAPGPRRLAADCFRVHRWLSKNGAIWLDHPVRDQPGDYCVHDHRDGRPRGNSRRSRPESGRLGACPGRVDHRPVRPALPGRRTAMRGMGLSAALRPACATLAAAALALACTPLGAAAQQILPPNFFALVPRSAGDNIAISSDTLTFDQPNNIVVAEGNVGINFEGLRVTADRAVYNRTTGAVTLEGNVALIDQDGLEYIADRVELEGDFRNGFIEALTVAFPDGTYFSAAETTLTDETVRTYNDALYSPCGTCIDEQGRRIGWQVRAVRIITDAG